MQTVKISFKKNHITIVSFPFMINRHLEINTEKEAHTNGIKKPRLRLIFNGILL